MGRGTEITLTIDFHTHIFPPWLRDQRERWLERDATFGELFSNPKAKLATVDDLLGAMDEDGIDQAVVMGMGWTDAGLAREVNDYIIESTRTHADRLIGFAGLNPAWGSEAAKEADRCAHAGLRGVGELHPDTQGYDLGDEGVMTPLLEAAQEHGLIITTHSSEPVGHLYTGKGRTTPDVLWRFFQNSGRFPAVKIICAHWGGGLPFYALMPEVKDALRNVYFDTAASPFLYTPQVFSTVERLVGADKILFASDYPLLRPKRLLKQLEESGLPAESQHNIRTSGLRLLGL
ncbi:MAG: amidohydrolase family protein [SAR202 cluster bacterium]|nr:amidohydrolase family protein [SAR202 cluster bacterium]MDP6513474.1 amidohydrolase family protein [SAR202 cluster bacterium]MDP6715043.1 amidohydrolase family protein [SAR202 cluster bacterium]